MKTKTVINERQFRDIPDGNAPGVLLAAEQPRWEYKTVIKHREADLAPYGADGWELVSAISQPGDLVAFYFKRQKS